MILKSLNFPLVTNGLIAKRYFTRTFHFDSLNLKVGFTRKVLLHPDSEKLYVSQIDLGPHTGAKQICSGLQEHIPLKDFQHRLVVVVDNLKKCKLRGQISEAMILCGEDLNGSVQLCRPQLNNEDLIGQQVMLKGQNVQPATKKLKPKVWEDIRSRLYVGEKNIVVYKGEDGVERELCIGEVPIVVDNLPRGSIVR